jgi:tRNA threonylcarbamoyladenosine biosynthesis protein TsaB
MKRNKEEAETGIPAGGGATGRLILGVDTCGAAGSVALGRLIGESVEILEQVELEGRSYSALLVGAVRGLLHHAGAALRDIYAIVAVSGPGSFTGVRVGLSAVKGLAQPAGIAVVTVSRLEVLAWKAGTGNSALDAHRHEVFLRLGENGEAGRELVAGAEELAWLGLDQSRVAVCEDAAAAVLSAAWPSVELVRGEAPTAGDALRLRSQTRANWSYVPLESLDGHYLRRSDAEIFGEMKARNG